MRLEMRLRLLKVEVTLGVVSGKIKKIDRDIFASQQPPGRPRTSGSPCLMIKRRVRPLEAVRSVREDAAPAYGQG